jgi:hypothetical protein
MCANGLNHEFSRVQLNKPIHTAKMFVSVHQKSLTVAVGISEEMRGKPLV